MSGGAGLVAGQIVAALDEGPNVAGGDFGVSAGGTAPLGLGDGREVPNGEDGLLAGQA